MTETANNTNETTTMDHQPRVRQCVFVLSLSAFFSLLLLYFFNVCANVSPHVAFREEEVTFHSLSFSLDGSIDLDFKSIPKPCEN
jgi:heme/copper-type cytochrome/quinol oxidase subunit 3